MNSGTPEKHFYTLTVDGVNGRTVAQKLSGYAGMDQGAVVQEVRDTSGSVDSHAFPTTFHVYSADSLRRFGRDLTARDAELTVRQKYVCNRGFAADFCAWSPSGEYVIESREQIHDYRLRQAEYALRFGVEHGLKARFKGWLLKITEGFDP